MALVAVERDAVQHHLHAAHAAFSAEFEGAVADFLASQSATMADLEVG